MILVSFFLLSITSAVTADANCTAIGGTCVDWRYYKCSAGVEQGLCFGNSDRRCCLECDNICVATEEIWASCCDSECTGANGVCQDISNYCKNSYLSGLCGGPSDRQCCGASSSGDKCPLVTFSSLNVIGYAGLNIKIEPGFKSSMSVIDSAASFCGVKVHITHAFRHEGQGGENGISPPSTTSNHFVGHAVDFNLDSPNGWCDGECLSSGNDVYAQCFVEKLKEEGLQWGGDQFSPDPVHIDDGLDAKNYDQWLFLYYDVQSAC